MDTYHDDVTSIPARNLSTRDIKRWIRHGAFAWPGGYPMYFITDDGAALSFATVKAEWSNVCDSIRRECSDGWRVIAVDINYEDGDLIDDHSGERIESAYGD